MKLLPALGLIAAVPLLLAQTEPQSGIRPARLILRGATVIEGNGTPARGPLDIVVADGRIESIQPSRNLPVEPGTAVIDARGKYVLPGFVNLHGHTQDERAGQPMPVDYCLKLWLAAGITTVRDVGSNFSKAKVWREESEKGTRAAPRLLLYRTLVANTPQVAVSRVRQYKTEGADGIKFFGIYRDVMREMLAEAKSQGLRTAHHTGVEETNALDDAAFGTTSIEHWYGVPDAALPEGVQGFPPNYNYNNELDRFRYAGRLWREADPQRLERVLGRLVEAGVAWDPTFSIYEAARDRDKAENQPYFNDFLHPVLAAFFAPNLDNHGSFFTEWTTADEIFWKENFQIWMRAVRTFASLGGVVGTGEDAGYIYRIYGFGYIRELELHQEAGFPPLKVLQHATHNGARILGLEHEIGRVRSGWKADLLVVNGNPLADFKILYPHSSRIEWTIKGGIPYRVADLVRDIKQMVAQAKAERGGRKP